MNKPDKGSPFFIFKPFDITTMGYYSYIDFKNLEYLKTKFDDWRVESNYLWQTKTKFERPVVRWYDNPKGMIWGIADYQNRYSWMNKNDPPYSTFVTQSESRSISVEEHIIYLDFPIWWFSKDVKNTTYGKFDYDVLMSFINTMNDLSLRNGNEWTKKNYFNLVKEYNERYPEFEDEEYTWISNSFVDLYGSFKKYGRLTVTVIDRPYTLFKGSSHNLFYGSVLGWKTLPIFVKIPFDKTKGKKGMKILKENWYCYIQPNNFAHHRFDDSEIFYMFYIDIKNEKFYGKKYDVSKFEYFKQNIQNLPSDLYKEFELIER